MSCGPSKALSALADKVDLANEKIDELIFVASPDMVDDTTLPNDAVTLFGRS